MANNYRVMCYIGDPHRPEDATPVALYAGLADFDPANRLLDHAIESGFAMGGHVEYDVAGIGWVLADGDDGERDPECYEHCVALEETR